MTLKPQAYIVTMLAFAGCQQLLGIDDPRHAAIDAGTPIDAAPPDAAPTTDAMMAFTCNNDSEIEPNNTIADGTQTTIPSSGPFRLVGLAICPVFDVDRFEFAVTANGVDVVVEIAYDAMQSELVLEVHKLDGSILSTGAPVGGDPNLVRVAIPNIAQDTYQAVVYSNFGENNYALEISLSQ